MTARRIVVRAFGGPEQLSPDTAPEVNVGAEELLVEVEAAGINYLDVYQRSGRYKLPLPYTPGFEGVGRVRQVGAGVSGFAVGNRVAWINVLGSYASQVIVPAAQAISVPDQFTTTQALMFQSLTAQYLVTEYRDVRPGDKVLVHSAAGGLGLLLVQWLKHLGAQVIGTTSTEAKAAAARAAGADAVIDYGRNYEFLDDLKSITGGRGVNLAFDGVGAATLESTLKGLARGGTAVSIGSASGPAPAIRPDQLLSQCARLAAGSVFSYTADPVELKRRAQAVIEGIQAGWLRIEQGREYPLDRAPEAHRDIESRSTQGKLYLNPELSADGCRIRT
jgi:NADPH2:quinone reductase